MNNIPKSFENILVNIQNNYENKVFIKVQIGYACIDKKGCTLQN